MIVSFFPMLCIAAAYYYMNRADPDCGTTFTWVSKAMGPKSGWTAGWAIIVADILVMPSLAFVAGQYTFQLVEWDAAASNKWAVLAIGIAWIIVMTWICWVGVELSARTQQILLSIEIFTLAPVRGRGALQGLLPGPRPARSSRRSRGSTRSTSRRSPR